MLEIIQNTESDFYCLGIDGGGTKTDLVLADQDDRVIRTLRTGACNPIDIGFETSKDILRKAIYEICQDIPFSKVCAFAGIAGGTSAGMQELFYEFFKEFHFYSFAIDSDIRNIMEAGLGKQDGITMILGTGICAFTQKDKKHEKVAGWGYLIDNGGSGYNLGRDALNAYFCAMDGTGKNTVLIEEIDALYPGGIHKLMEYIYREGKRAVASFAPAIFAAIEKGDSIAENILQRNIKEAVHIIETAAVGFSVEKIPLILAGGLTNQPIVIERLKSLLHEPQRFEIQVLSTAPVHGAVMLARELRRKVKNAEN